MGNELRGLLFSDDAGDSWEHAVDERPDSASRDLMEKNAIYSASEDSDDSEIDVPLPDNAPKEDGNNPCADASAAASREPATSVSVADSQGIMVGDDNVMVNISVEVTLDLEAALERLEQGAPQAAALVFLLASLPPQPVPLNRLLETRDAARRPGTEAAWALGRLPHGPAGIREATARLRRDRLAVAADNGLVQMPGLARDRARARLTRSQHAASWTQAAAVLVEAALAAAAQLPDARQACAALLPHAAAVLDLTSHGIWRVALSLARSSSYAAARDLCALIVDAYGDRGDYGPGYLAASEKLTQWTMLAANEA